MAGKILAVALVTSGAAAMAISGVYFCNSWVHLDPSAHHTASGLQADEFSRRANATWIPARISAADGTPLEGWLFQPKRPNGDAVIVLHGISDSRAGMLTFTKLLLDRNYTVLAPDSRSHGSSGGDVVTFGIKESGDVHDWADWLVRTIQPRNLFGLGESLGAGVILQALPVEPRFRAVVAESPFANIGDIGYERLVEYSKLHSRLRYMVLAPVMGAVNVYGRLRYGVWLSSASPERAIAGTHTPVLLIHDGLDDAVPPSHTAALVRANPQFVTVWEVQDAIHTGASGIHPAEFSRRVDEWFQSHAVASATVAATE